MKKPKIVAVVGSLQRFLQPPTGSFGQRSGGGSGKFELLEYSDVPMMNEDIEFPPPEPVQRVRQVIASADGVWFFTPEYNHFFPGVLKNLIDWLSRPVDSDGTQVLSGKPAAISGASLGMSGTGLAQDHLVTLISFLNMKVMNYPRLTIPDVWQQLDEEKKRLSSAPLTCRSRGCIFGFSTKQLIFAVLYQTANQLREAVFPALLFLNCLRKGCGFVL